jgi:hypothetical protein
MSPVEWYRPGPPDIRVERILRIQGYGDLSKVRPAIRRAAEYAADLARRLSEPAVCFRRVAIRGLEGGRLDLDGGITLNCEAFGRLLAGCHEAVAFVLTVGAGVDRKVVELTETGEGLLEALLLETAGWLAVEDATRQFRSAARAQAERAGQRITTRLGPGYRYAVDGAECEWALTDQLALFELFGDADLPVQVLPSCAMLPKISRSGLFGVGAAGGA